jgi:hypothetical protein
MTRSRGKGAVSINLSDKGKQAWTDAGSNKPNLGDKLDCARQI